MAATVFNALKNLRSSKKLASFGEWYHDIMGYRRMGLLYDDMVPEENPVVEEALRRLSPKEHYDRQFRYKRAMVYSLRQEQLPNDLWTKAEDDIPYLRPLIATVENEFAERTELDNMTSVPEKFLKRNKLQA